MPPVLVHQWDNLPCDHPMPLLDRRRVIGQHAMLSMVTLHKGFLLEPHAHENEQFSCVLEGKVRFTIIESGVTRTVTLGRGEVLHLPPHAPHGAEAIETSLILDVFSPPSATTGVDRPQADPPPRD